MPPEVLYLIEHVARELDIACAIRHLARERSHVSVDVASIHFDLHRTIARLRPRVIVTPYFYSAHDANLRYLIRGFPQARIVNLAFEQMLSKGNLSFKRPNEPVVRQHVLHLASGTFFRDFLCGHGVAPKNVRLVGSLSLALYRPPYRGIADNHRAALARQYDLDPHKPWIFFPENYSAAFMSDDQIESRIRQGFDRHDAYHYRHFARSSMQTVVPWCWQAARQGTAEWIFRPRPSTSEVSFVSACRECAGGPLPKNMHFIKAGTVREWNLACQIVVTSYSTSALEAAVAGKSVYLLVPQPFPDYMHVPWHDQAPQIQTPDALWELVRDPSRARPAIALQAWAETNLLGYGDPIEHAAAIVADVALGRCPAPPPPGINKGIVATALHAVRHRTRVLMARRTSSHPHYDSDLFTQQDVLVRTAQWASRLSVAASDQPKSSVHAA
jgi:hypothetical protein